MRIVVTLFIFFVAVILQVTLVQFISVFYILPNLVLMVGISWAVLRDYKEVLLCGLFSGVMLDILSGTAFGVKTLSLVIILVSINLLTKEFLSGPRILLLISLAFGGTIFYALLGFGFLNLFFYLKLIHFKPELVWYAPLEQGIYNIFLMILVFWVLSKIDKWLLYYSKQIRLSR